MLVAPPKKKVLILLTDGHNEPAGPHALDPPRRRALPAALGVTLHTIAIGHVGGAPPPGLIPRPSPGGWGGRGPNLPLLEKLAELTAGRSFVATDTDTLREIFRTIDALERSRVAGRS